MVLPWWRDKIDTEVRTCEHLFLFISSFSTLEQGNKIISTVGNPLIWASQLQNMSQCLYSAGLPSFSVRVCACLPSQAAFLCLSAYLMYKRLVSQLSCQTVVSQLHLVHRSNSFTLQNRHKCETK